MIDEVTVQIFDADGNAVSVARTDSIQSYAIRMLGKKDTKADVKTLLVDELNYGAAAQSYFKYATDNLANKNLTEAQQALATQNVSLTNELVKGTHYFGSSLKLESNIKFVIAYKFTDVETSGLTATVSFTNHYGNKISKVYDLQSDEETNGKYHILEITDLVVADMNQLVTIEVKNAEGTIIDTTQDSIGGYLKRMEDKSDVNEDALYENIAKFCTSAYAYFHQNNS